MASFADMVNERLKALGMSQAKFSKALGVSPPYVNQVLKGKRSRIRLEMAVKWAEALRLTGQEAERFILAAEAERVGPESPLSQLAGLDVPPIEVQPWARQSKVFNQPEKTEETDLTRAANAMLAEELAALKARLQKVTKERDAERKRAQAAEAEIAVLNQLLSQEMARSVPTPDHDLTWEPDTSKLPRLRAAESPDKARGTPPRPREPAPAAGPSDQSTPLRTNDGR